MTETECVYCVVRTWSLYIIQVNFLLWQIIGLIKPFYPPNQNSCLIKLNEAVVLNQHYQIINSNFAAAVVQSLCRTTKEPFDLQKWPAIRYFLFSNAFRAAVRPTQRVPGVKRLGREFEHLATSGLDTLRAVPPRHHTPKRRAASPFHHNLAQLFRHLDRNVVLVLELYFLTHLRTTKIKITTKISLSSGAGIAQSVHWLGYRLENHGFDSRQRQEMFPSP
jgi:hypothetical protein